eukprot:SAG11_NODE_7976_length_1074_cov_52.168205_2_plen_100_part_00
MFVTVVPRVHIPRVDTIINGRRTIDEPLRYQHTLMLFSFTCWLTTHDFDSLGVHRLASVRMRRAVCSRRYVQHLTPLGALTPVQLTARVVGRKTIPEDS